MKEVCAKHGKLVRLGVRGEHLARCITFDIGDWRATYGEGTVQLLVQRSQDQQPYPCSLIVGEGKACWAVRDVDVAMAGNGKIELQYRVGDTVVKSETYATLTLEAMGEAGPVPSAPEKAWVDMVLQAARDAEQSAQDARNAVTQVVTVGENGNWFIDGEDTGVGAVGPQGPQGAQGEAGFPEVVTLVGAAHAVSLESNIDYCFADPVTVLTVAGFLADPAGKSEVWSVHFVAGETITVSLPDKVIWNHGAVPVFTPGSEYFLMFTPLLSGKVLGVWNEVEA